MELNASNLSSVLDSCTVSNDGHRAMRDAFPGYVVYLTVSGDFLALGVENGKPTKRFRLVEVDECD